MNSIETNLEIYSVAVGLLETNCYLLVNSKSNEALLIDPGAEADKIIQLIEAKKAKVKYIINTHSHYDHIGANLPIKEYTKAPILINEKEMPLFVVMEKMQGVSTSRPDAFIKQDQVLSLDLLEFKVIETPGHSPGGICLKINDIIFSGDTLFAGAIGRYDLPFASKIDLKKSLNKLFQYDEKTIVYPGHGPKTTIGKEKIKE